MCVSPFHLHSTTLGNAVKGRTVTAERGLRMKNSISFEATEDGMKLMATFIAQLVREGVVFTTENKGSTVVVTLTGGY